MQIVLRFFNNVCIIIALLVLYFLLLATAAIGDRRLIGQYIILSVILMFNVGSVLVGGLYLNRLPDYMFQAGFDPYDGISFLSNAHMIAGSVIAILSFIYYAFIMMDITVTNRRKMFLQFSDDAPVYPRDSFFSIFRW
jgi:hypothetical protein